jgi:hypothetical protein
MQEYNNFAFGTLIANGPIIRPEESVRDLETLTRRWPRPSTALQPLKKSEKDIIKW